MKQESPPGKNCITVAICCYNGAAHLGTLIDEIAGLECPVPSEILIVDNNSTDNTREIVAECSKRLSVPIRYVLESQQGIPYARNRAIAESMHNAFMAFIDVDERPEKSWLEAAIDGLITHSADCVGGEIAIDLADRPKWMSDSILLFLGKVDYGRSPFKITDRTTPIWSGNIAYRTSLFADGLRFDTRYNRVGSGIGGGEDGIMFREMLSHDVHMRYEPEMRIRHLIPNSKLKRAYFIKLHFIAGKKSGLYETGTSGITLFGIPRFMFIQLIRKTAHALRLATTRNPEYMREVMNASHLFGMMSGLYIASRQQRAGRHE